jgi:hypothetical protein
VSRQSTFVFQWKDFNNILAATTGIDDIRWESAAKPVGYYNIQGQQLPLEPEHGIYTKLG